MIMKNPIKEYISTVAAETVAVPLVLNTELSLVGSVMGIGGLVMGMAGIAVGTAGLIKGSKAEKLAKAAKNNE